MHKMEVNTTVSRQYWEVWNDLPTGGKQIQTRLLTEVDRFSELVRTLTRNLPSTPQADLKDDLEIVRSMVNQEGLTWRKTMDGAINDFRKSIDKIINTIESYWEASSDDTLAIPDTSAMIGNPDVEDWRFEDTSHYTIILTPTILSELDDLKDNGRKTQEVRDKAAKIVRKIKEYRRRGSLNEGVVIVNGLISLGAVAVEPNMTQTLSWLDPTIPDDRFLATALEVIRGNLGARVFIVTSDINMQNKAEIAGIPFQEVPSARGECEK